MKEVKAFIQRGRVVDVIHALEDGGFHTGDPHGATKPHEYDHGHCHGVGRGG